MMGAICADLAGSMVSAVGPGFPSGPRRHEACTESQRPDRRAHPGRGRTAFAALHDGGRPGHDGVDGRHRQRRRGPLGTADLLEETLGLVVEREQRVVGGEQGGAGSVGTLVGRARLGREAAQRGGDGRHDRAHHLDLVGGERLPRAVTVEVQHAPGAVAEPEGRAQLVAVPLRGEELAVARTASGLAVGGVVQRADAERAAGEVAVEDGVLDQALALPVGLAVALLDVLDAHRAGGEDRRRVGGEERGAVVRHHLAQPVRDVLEELLVVGGLRAHLGELTQPALAGGCGPGADGHDPSHGCPRGGNSLILNSPEPRRQPLICRGPHWSGPP